MQCQVGWYFLSNSFLMCAATSRSMPYLDSAVVATSTASCCISSLMSAFLITARRRSDITDEGKGRGKDTDKGGRQGRGQSQEAAEL